MSFWFRPSPRRRTGYRPHLERLESREVPVGGMLDANFGQAGLVAVPFHNGSLGSASAAPEPNRAVVFAGLDLGGDLVVTRLTSTGRVDPTFGSGGTEVLPESLKQVGGVVVTSAGQVVTVGRTGAGNFVVTRLNRNGHPDTTFGSGGIFTVTANVNSLAGLAIAQHNEILVAGSTPGGQVLVARLTSRGPLDGKFGSAGKATLLVPGTFHAGGGNGVSITSTNKVVVVGTELTNTAHTLGEIEVVRLTTTGRLDATFGSVGTALIGDNQDQGTAAVALPGGRILIAGTDHTSIAVARLTSAGRLDGFFDTGRLDSILSGLGTVGSGVNLSLAPGGRIVVAATNGGTTFGVGRLTRNGLLDLGFNNSGQIIVTATPAQPPGPAFPPVPGQAPFSTSIISAAGGVAVDVAGRIVVSGDTTGKTGLEVSAARLLGR